MSEIITPGLLNTIKKVQGETEKEKENLNTIIKIIGPKLETLKQEQLLYFDDVHGDPKSRREAFEDLTETINSDFEKGGYYLSANPNPNGKVNLLKHLQKYMDAQLNYKKKLEEMATRQFKLVKSDATQSEIEDVLKTGGEGIFTQNMLTSQNAKSAYEDVQEKHKAIQRLEESNKDIKKIKDFIDDSDTVHALKAKYFQGFGSDGMN